MAEQESEGGEGSSQTFAHAQADMLEKVLRKKMFVLEGCRAEAVLACPWRIREREEGATGRSVSVSC